MTYRCSGPPPFKPVVGERLILVEEGFPAHAEVGTNLAVRREKATLVITEVSPRISRWQDYSNTERAKFIVARNPAGRGVYISAYIPQTQIVWLDRTPSGGLKTSYTTEDLSAPPLITKETDELFTTRTQETKAGVIGQVQFESAIVWESEPFPKGEYDDEIDGGYPGLKQASDAAVAAKKAAVENLFKNV